MHRLDLNVFYTLRTNNQQYNGQICPYEHRFEVYFFLPGVSVHSVSGSHMNVVKPSKEETSREHNRKLVLLRHSSLWRWSWAVSAFSFQLALLYSMQCLLPKQSVMLRTVMITGIIITDKIPL